MARRVITAREQLQMLSPWRRASYGDPMGEQDWKEIYDDLPDTVHRGLGVTLPDDLHRMVHDPSIPTEQRAQALLKHLSTPEARTNPWGGRDWREGLGTSWSGNENVAEDFARSMASQHTDHNDEDHVWGTDEDGDPVSKPGTAVMLHAQRPELDEIDDNPNGDGSGQRYTYHGHGEQEVPVHQGTGMNIKGISWRPILPWNHPGYLTDPEEYTRHEFGEHNYHTAQLEMLSPWRTAAAHPSTYDKDHPLGKISLSHPYVDMHAWESPQGIKLNMIQVAPEHQNNGYAGAALRDLLNYADSKGVPVALTPGIPEGRKGMSAAGLKKWYSSHGFVPNRGRNKDWNWAESMIRPARQEVRDA